MVMNMKIIYKIVRFMAAVVIIFGVAFAQEGERVQVSDIGLRAGPRGLMLVIDGAGPMRVDVPPSQAAQYQELRVTVNNGVAAGGGQAFTPPAELPLREIVLEDRQGGLFITVRARGPINGPVDLRGGGTNQVRILLTRDPQPEMNWSAMGRSVPAAKAAAGEIRAEPVDMKRIEERAVKDTQAPAGGDMFSVKEPPHGQRRQAAPGGPPQITHRTETPAAQPEVEAAATETPTEQELVRYRVYGRDPFVPLVRDTTSSDLPRVENLRLVGVLEDARERIALVEDYKNGNRAFALRANDAVEHGKVLRVQRDRVVFLIRDFDVSRSYTLSLSTGR